jgi:hypothetical protein
LGFQKQEKLVLMRTMEDSMQERHHQEVRKGEDCGVNCIPLNHVVDASDVKTKVSSCRPYDDHCIIDSSYGRSRSNICHKRTLSSSGFLAATTTLLLWIALCGSTVVVDAVSLLGGRYETTTDVTDYLNLALDAADMKETDDLTTKKNIYQNVRKR